MSKQIINLGQTANDRTGDPLRTAFEKVNANFTELYSNAGIVADDTAPTAPGEGDLWWDSISGRLYVYYGTSWVDASPVESAGISSTNKLVNGASEVVLDDGGMLTVPGSIALPDGVITGNDNSDPGMVLGSSNKSVFVSTLSGIDQYKWKFGTDGTVTFPNGETLLSQPSQLYFHKDDNDYVGEIVLQAEGVGIQATHPTLGNSLINISTNGATISINNNEWEFDRNGTQTVPAMFPLTFTAVLDRLHMLFDPALDGEPWTMDVTFSILDGGLVTEVEQIFPIPSNPGYVSGYAFTFTEADHGIPGYTFELELRDVVLPGGAGWTANIGVSSPPELPKSLISTRTLVLHGNTGVVLSNGSGSHQEQFRFEGRNLILPGNGDIRDYLGNTVLTNLGNLEIDQSTILTTVDTSIVIQTSERTRVTAACYIANGDQFVADTEFNDDITVVQPGWTVSIDDVVYTVASVDDSVGNMYRITATGATFVQGVAYTFYSADATAYEWEFRANGGISGPGGVILTNETAPLGGGGTYRDFSIELPTPDGLNEQRWTFSNDGDFTAPGDIFAGSFLGQSLEITSAGIVSSTYAGDLQTLHVAGAVGKGLTLGVDGGLVSWLFKPNGTLTLPQYHWIESVGSNATISLNGIGSNESSIYLSTNLDGEQIGSSFEIHPNGVGLNTVRSIDIHAGYDEATFKRDAWQGAEAVWTEIRDQDAQIIAPEVRPWAGLPSYQAYDILMGYTNPPGVLPPGSNMAPAAYTAKAAYELWQAEQAAINVTIQATDKTWTFGNNGQLTVPGPIFRDGGLYMNSSGSTTAASVFVNGFGGSVILRTADNANNVSHDLVFDVNGNLGLPSSGAVNATNLNVDYINYQTNTSIQVGQPGGGRFNVAMERFQVLANAPTTSVGSDGDVVGCVAFDATYIYYCTGLYNGVSNIWKRLLWSGDTW